MDRATVRWPSGTVQELTNVGVNQTLVIVEPLHTAVSDGDTPRTPVVFRLSQNHPNPFNAATSIEFLTPKAGPVSLVTTDAAGNLGVSTLDIGLLQSTAGRIGSLEGRVDTLFDLAAVERRETNRGIAAAVALTPAPMPSEVGRVSYAANASVYRGELGLGASVAARVNSDTPLAVTMGVSYSGGKNTAARVGVAGEF